ncbi:MAG: tetratricopeptide repeat protein [Deltaproteobacteria bacterium]|nr:tetratricopeptide repeat protein [Deltaproteobacteria bacterium]
MVKKARELIEIDLDQFKLHLKIKDKTELSLHFDSRSRRFYISVIALVVSEMKRLGEITSIPLEHHYDLLALLNETVGGSAGSSEKGNLLPRIYKKWKSALSDLEHAPLFNVLGKRKGYVDDIGKTYRFSEEEKDLWANLFEYKGSHDKIRLRFSVDKLGVGLNDVVITYGKGENLTDVAAWKRYVDDLKEQMKDMSEPAVSLEPSPPISGPKKWSIVWSTLLNKRSLAALAGLILVLALIAFWNIYFRTPESRDGSATELALDLNQKPSIAVLPFANISGDPKEDYLSDGITEQIISALSKTPQMLVIARNSVFTYKGKPVMVQQVSEELGVRYVLVGSVQKEGDRLRITAQLIDAKTGNHMWSERYDRDLKNIFALQDDITKNIIAALQVKLTHGELAGKDTNSLEAYLKMMKGQYHQWRYNKNDNEIATRFAKEAIELDPGYASAYLLLAWNYCQEADFRWTETPWKSYEKAIELAEKAISLDEQSAPGYMALANLYAKTKRFDEAMSAGNKGLSLDPTSSTVNSLYGYMLCNLGKFKQAIPFFEKAIHTDPKPPRWFMDLVGKCYYETGRFKEAISFFEKVIRLDPKPPSWGRSRMGWAYFYTDRNEEAIASFEKYVRHEPENAYAHAALGCALIAAGKPEEADAVLEKALSMDMPGVIHLYSWISCNLTVARFGARQHEEEIRRTRNLFEHSRVDVDASVHRYMALILIFEGKYDEAPSIAEEAIRLQKTGFMLLDPDAPFSLVLGLSHLMMGQYEEAVKAFEEAIHIWPEYIYGHIGLTAAYRFSGRMEDARAEAAEVLKINPDFSLSDIAKNGYYNFQKANKERFISALRKAGLK